MNGLAVTNLLLGLLDRATVLSNLLKTAAAEGRDITAEELDGLFADDAAARAQLDAAIDAARAG